MTPPRSHLVACPGCARHVRASEASCPFCKGPLAESVRAAPPRRPPAERLSRAGLVAFGVGTLAVATACGGEVEGQGGGVSVPFYGASTIIASDDGGDDGGVDGDDEPSDAGETPDAVGVVLYGGVSFADSGFDDDASSDAEPPPDAFIAPPYGLPPPPPPPTDP